MKQSKGQYYQSESVMQTHCVRWFRYQYPKYAGNLFSVPNGADVSGTNRIKLSNEGLLPGVADLFLAVPSLTSHGLFIEMKTPAGTLSDVQRSFRDDVTNQGYKYVVCRSTDEFMIEIINYLKP